MGIRKTRNDKGKTYEEMYGKNRALELKKERAKVLKMTNIKFKGIFPANKIQREKRFCKCKCKQFFICKVNSKKRFISGHNINILSSQEKSRRSKKMWKNKSYAKKTLEAQRVGRKIKPNKPERILNKILGKDYKFVGDGKIWIERYNPDFINANGQKKIVEMFGDYWHKNTKEKDKQRLKTYKKYGYKTLVVWEKELKNLDKLKNRIIKFQGQVGQW